MTVEEVYELCVLHKHLKSGGRNCKNINKVFKTIPNKPQGQFTKNKKIEIIEKYFDDLSHKTIEQLLINRQQNGDIQEDT